METGPDNILASLAKGIEAGGKESKCVMQRLLIILNSALGFGGDVIQKSQDWDKSFRGH